MTPREIRDEPLVTDHPVLGRRVTLVLPVIPEAAPYKIREGIARRRIAATTARCPCGAVLEYDELEPEVVEVQHEGRCPAVTETLTKALRRWMR